MENPNTNPQTTRRKNNDYYTIDLLELIGVLLRWLWLIVIVALVFGVIAFCYSKFALPEQFQSTTKVYVLNRSDNNTGNSPTASDMQVSSQLTKDYAEMITSRHVLEQVISDMDLPYQYEYLKSKVIVSVQPDTRIIQITVTDEDPRMAQKLANTVRLKASEHIQNVMDVDAINVVDMANLPTYKSYPDNTRNALMFAMIGAFLVCAVVIIRYLLDDTIKTREDVEKYLGMSCLALIPLDEAVNKDEPAGKKRKKKAGRWISRRSGRQGTGRTSLKIRRRSQK